MPSIPRQEVKADLLVIGGGPAGLMAAIRAAELGAKVVLAEKSNTRRSGSGSGGNDHFECYIPEFHGRDIKPILEEYMYQPAGGHRADFAKTWLERSFEMVGLWDSWGIPMKYKGKWEFAGHAFPGRPRIFLKYAGGNQKPVLTEQALKRGVEIRNRVTVFELLKEGDRVVGALGFDTWKDQVIVFSAKAVFLGTGLCSRLYPSSTPGWMFNIPVNPVSTGDGRAMLYRAGGELVDMEFTGQWAGPKYFSRAGKATWIGVLTGPDDKPVGPFIRKPNKVYGDITSDIWTTVFDEHMQSGKGPVYMNLRGASNADVEYMLYWLRHEGNQGLLDHMSDEGIDVRKNPVEFRTYEIGVKGGVRFNVSGESSLKGLFSAGDEFHGAMANAVIWGWIAGENAARYVKTADFADMKRQRAPINRRISVLEAMLSRTEGATWKEANTALQQLMSEYAGLVRSESLLDQGLRNLGRLREKVNQTLMAGNGHEVGRCLEVLSLLDVGEMVMLTAKERKETRAKHNRPDYPFTNPLLDKSLVIKKEAGKAVLQWKQKV
jgi:succinate dehydrogenase/fumarate reductase flavoprotein subunit